MAIANTKSTAITNADETQPRAYTQSWIERGDAKFAVAEVEVAAADDNNSVYRFVRISSGARIRTRSPGARTTTWASISRRTPGRARWWMRI